MPPSSRAASIGGSTMSTPIGMSATPSALRSRGDLAGGGPEQAGIRGDRAAQPDHPGVDVLRAQPRAVQPVVLGRRPEIPDVRVAAAGEQRVAGHLVARPLADVGARDVADVVEVEERGARRPPMPRAPRGPGRAGTSAAGRRSSAPPSRRSSSRGRRDGGITTRTPMQIGPRRVAPGSGRFVHPCYTARATAQVTRARGFRGPGARSVHSGCPRLQYGLTPVHRLYTLPGSRGDRWTWRR